MNELLQNGRLSEMMSEKSDFRPMNIGTPRPTNRINPLGKGAKRQFLAAAHSRLNSDWPSVNISSDEALWRNLRTLRGRSRWLADNNGYYMHYIQMNVSNIIGAKGIKLDPRIQDKAGKLDKEANSKIELSWKKWGKKGVCTKRMNWSKTDLERVVIATTVRDGEVFLRKWFGVDNGFGYALEIIDPMRVPAELIKVLDSSTEIINGIEYKGGEVTAYYMAKRGMKGDWNGENYERVDAKYIIHVYFPLWAEQKRGFPWLASGMQRIHMLDRYENAEVVAARIVSENGGYFTKSPAAEAGFSGEQEDGGQDIERMESEAGSYNILPEGWSFTPYNPTHPTTAFQPFTDKLLKGVAAAGNVGYTDLANDLSSINYSSARIEAIRVQDNWKEKQNWIIEWFHEVIYADWLSMAMSSGALQLNFADKWRYDRVVWIPRSWAWVDPLKEAAGNKTNVDMRVTSLSEIAADKGDDIQDVFEQLAKEKQMAEDLGLDMADVFGHKKTSIPEDAITTTEVIRAMQGRIDEMERRMAGYKINGVKPVGHEHN